MRIVIESPLSGDTTTNLRYLLWCCRAVFLAGHDPIASHLVVPWFADDSVPAERERGIASEWFWQEGDEHWFLLDLGLSSGMKDAVMRSRQRLPIYRCLSDYAPECWEAFERGEWPPHTKGFEVAAEVIRDRDRWKASYVELAEALGLVNRPEGQGGYDVAPHEQVLQTVREGARSVSDRDEWRAVVERVDAALARVRNLPLGETVDTVEVLVAEAERLSLELREARIAALRPAQPTVSTRRDDDRDWMATYNAALAGALASGASSIEAVETARCCANQTHGSGAERAESSPTPSTRRDDNLPLDVAPKHVEALVERALARTKEKP
jgi:hypothetical protein